LRYRSRCIVKDDTYNFLNAELVQLIHLNSLASGVQIRYRTLVRITQYHTHSFIIKEKKLHRGDHGVCYTSVGGKFVQQNIKWAQYHYLQCTVQCTVLYVGVGGTKPLLPEDDGVIISLQLHSRSDEASGSMIRHL